MLPSLATTTGTSTTSADHGGRPARCRGVRPFGCGRLVPTDVIGHDVATALGDYAALWVAPGGPYRSMDGVLRAIRYARERRVPLLGTCGGCQHVILEYARWPTVSLTQP